MADLMALLYEIKAITERYREARLRAGADFNVWNILGRTTAEEEGHSAFIAELLNEKGSHGQGRLYLDLFFDVLQEQGDPPLLPAALAERCRTVPWQVEVEHAFQLNDEDEKDGRLDLLLSNGDGYAIIVENKVRAGDQTRQMVRYWKYAKARWGEDRVALLYLTPLGGRPGDDSLGKNDPQGREAPDPDRVRLISYRDTISPWIRRCIEVSALLPLIRETLQQYHDVIRQITNQSPSEQMTMDIVDLMTKTPANLQAGLDAANAANAAKAHIQMKFWQALEQQLAPLMGTLGASFLKQSSQWYNEPDIVNYYEKGDSKSKYRGVGLLLDCGESPVALPTDRFRLSLWVIVDWNVYYVWDIRHRAEGTDRLEGMNLKDLPCDAEEKGRLIAAFQQIPGRLGNLDQLGWVKPSPETATEFHTFGRECVALADNAVLQARVEGIAQEIRALVGRTPMAAFRAWRSACLTPGSSR